MQNIPSLDQFLNAPLEEIKQIAPKTAIICVGGTRRSAALEGIEAHSAEFFDWSRTRMLEQMDLLFQHGIQHIIAIAIVSPNLVEFETYRQRFFTLVEKGLAGKQMLADYNTYGWRVKMIGTEELPELQKTASILQEHTNNSSDKTLWWIISPHINTPWQSVFDIVAKTGARTRNDAIQAMYGEQIPLATLMIGTGKPILMYDLIPPLLVGNLQCYWIQQPGYRLNQTMLRTILYDYAYLRNNEAAKIDVKYMMVDKTRQAWETNAVLGVGERLGVFWYPLPFPAI
jgi:hypothetical protein